MTGGGFLIVGGPCRTVGTGFRIVGEWGLISDTEFPIVSGGCPESGPGREFAVRGRLASGTGEGIAF